AELVGNERLPDLGDGGVELGPVVGDGRGRQEDTAVEVSEEELGARFGTIEADNAEVLRTDQLHAGVQDAARLGDTRRRPARRRAFAGTSRGHETSLRKRDGDLPIFAAGAPERVLFSLKPTYQGTS